MSHRLSAPLGLALVAALSANVARAEKKSSLKPPVLVEVVEATYPAEAKKSSLEGSVVLLLTVDEKGQVVEARVKTAAGHGFDEAALAAARRFRFQPASLDGKPVAVAVTYTYRFVMQPPPPASLPTSRPASPPTAPKTTPPPPARQIEPVNLAGRVRERGTRRPLAMVEVGLPAAKMAAPASSLTDAEGRFLFRGVPRGKHALRFSKSGYRIAEATVEVRSGEKTTVDIFIEKLGAYNAYQLTVRGKRPKQRVTRHVIRREEVQRIPGTHGDTLKVVEVMPGVARTPFGMGGMIVLRGADHQSSGVYLDGTFIPQLFHFAGLRSVINSDLIERLDLYPGNAGVLYGNLIGGVIDVRIRDPKRDRLHLQLDVNAFEGGLLVEGPITDKLSFVAAFHRNWHDLVLGAVLDSEEASFTVAPRYYDYQAKLYYQISKRQSVDLFWIGSDDKMELVVGQDEEVGFNFGNHTFFHQMKARHRLQIDERKQNALTASVLWSGEEGDYGAESHVDILGLSAILRDQFRWQLGDRLRLDAGLVGGMHYYEIDFTAPHFSRMGEVSFGSENTTELRSSIDNFTVLTGGAYAELLITPWPWLKVIPGVRLDVNNYNEELSPAGSLAVRVKAAAATVLKAAAGTRTRIPVGPAMSKDYGNPDLANERSYQLAAGLEQEVTDNINVDLTAFYTDMRQLVVSNPALNTDPSAVPYTNDGRGRSYGLELMIKHQPSRWFHGWLSYTLSRSERRFPGKDWTLFGLDQTHILNAVGMFRLPGNWSIGFRFCLISGNPTDLYSERGGLNADNGRYIPVPGTMRQSRLPLVHALDLRVDKTLVFDRWLWTIYLDVKNAYNHRSKEFVVWNYDYTQYDYVEGLPILPTIGSRIEF